MAIETTTRAPELSRPHVFSALANRNFSLLIAGRTTSNMGRSMRVFARAWLVLELTGSPLLLGLVTSSLSWPMLFMPFLGGVLADRIDRRKLLLYTEFSLVALWTAVSLIITLGLIQWWHLMISGVLSGMIQSIGRPGHEAMIGSVVDKKQLPNAVALDAAAHTWPNEGGLLIATLIIGFAGTAGIFWITTLCQLITGITLLMMHWQPQEIAEASKSVRTNFVEGLKYVRGERVMLGLVFLSAASSLFAGSYHFLLPFFARDILGVGAQGLGVLMLLSTLGVSIGSALVVGLANIPRRGLLLMLTALGYTLFIAGFARSEVFFLSLALLFCMGLFATFSRTTMTMIMQLLAPNEMRGRVMSLRVTMMGLSWIGVLWMGAIAEYIGVADTVLIGAGLYGLAALAIFLRMPSLRRFN